ncbi:phosphoribosylformylglycinamidine cyclo-ligase [Corynebacterium diphtheriae]|nr:phosphoribosylformylglycinamidine cyclo-ligase [Corynebacterium diphtheriae]
MALADECEVHTFCHVTGGGLAGNLARVIPEGLTAELSRATWTPGQIFRTIETIGQVPQIEMEKTFNMGVGMVAVVAPKDRDRALAILTARHIDAWELGAVRATEGEEPSVILTGNHPGY